MNQTEIVEEEEQLLFLSTDKSFYFLQFIFVV